MPDLIYIANLDDKQVLAALKRIDQGFNASGKAGDKAFSGVGKSAGTSGLAIGAMAGAVGALVVEFINLGQQATEVLTEIGADAVKMAATFEVNKGFIKNIFEGDEEAANAVIDRLISRGTEIGLGPDAAIKLGTSFLPDVGSIEQLDKIIDSTIKLKALAPEKSIEDIRQALEQGLSGDVLPLQDRLNLPREVVPRIKELQKEFGNAEGLLRGLDEVFTKFGVNLEDIASTGVGKFGELQARLEEIQLAGGETALEALKPILDDILTFLTDNKDALILFAASLGDAAGSAAQFVAGLTGLNELDSAGIAQLGQDVFAFVTGLETTITLIGGWVGTVGELIGKLLTFIAQVSFAGTAISVFGSDLGEAGQSVSDFFGSLFKGDSFFTKFLDFLAQSKAGLEGIAAILGNLTASAAKFAQALGATLAGDYVTATELAAEAQNLFNSSLDAGRKATNESYSESRKAIDAYGVTLDDQAKKQQELAEKLKQTTDAGLNQAETFLNNKKASEDAAKVAGELAAAQEKVNEKFTEAEKDFQQELQDIDIAAERKRLDAQIEFAQKREDAARDNLEKIADLYRKNEQDIADAATDLNRKEEDIARKFSQERIDLEKEQRQERVDIEKDFRQKLQDIQSTFLEDADEAEQKRDAVAFLRAIKQRDKAVAEAQQERITSIEQVRIEGEQRAAELAIQRQRELEEARIDNERKLEDIRLNLERQIEEQNIAYARQLDDIRINEERKNEELRVARERDIEDAKLAYERKLEDLRAALAEELALIEAHAAAVAAAQNKVSALKTQTTQKSGGGSNISTNKNQKTQVMQIDPGFASGGFVGAGRTALVGENGPELVKFPSTGLVMNSQRTASIINQQKMDNSKNFSMGMIDPNAIDSLLASKIRNILANELMGI